MDARIIRYSGMQAGLRFCRWSRKRYAAFISIHRQVTMGRLAAALVERFHLKQQALHGSLGVAACGTRPEADDTRRESSGGAVCLGWMGTEGAMCLMACLYVSLAMAVEAAVYELDNRSMNRSRRASIRVGTCPPCVMV